MFGIDRIKLKDIPIGQVNIKELKARGFLVIQDNANAYRILKDSITGEEVGINYIKVSKQQDETLKINELKIGRGVIPELNILPTVDYEHLDINLPSQISKNRINDKNINSLEDLTEALGQIEKELESLGFGEIDLMKTKLKEIEINTNIPIERPFKDYESVITYLFGLLPKTLKDQRNHKKKGVFTGIVTENTQQQLKFYDKRQQIKDKTGIDTEAVIRIEYTFKTEEKIRTALKGETLEDITKDDFKTLQETMKSLLYNDLIEKAYKDIDKQRKHAARHLKKYKGKGGATAGQEYIFDYDIFDIEIMLQALKDIDKARNFTRDARKEIDRAEQGKQIKLFGNLHKLNEILNDLGYKKIEMKLTPTIKKELKKYY